MINSTIGEEAAVQAIVNGVGAVQESKTMASDRRSEEQ